MGGGKPSDDNGCADKDASSSEPAKKLAKLDRSHVDNSENSDKSSPSETSISLLNLSDDVLLQVPVNGVWRPLCKDTVVKVMRMQLVRMGLNPDEYAFHSFRRGGIQEAVRAQPSLELVRLQSGHVSDAIHAYSAMPGEARMVTVALMLESLEQQFYSTSA